MKHEKVRHIDLGKALPLVMRDWRQLAKSGVSLASLSEQRFDRDPDKIMIFVEHVLAKAGAVPGATDDMSMSEFAAIASEVMDAVLESEGEKVDRPTSTSSTSSDAPTDGASGN